MRANRTSAAGGDWHWGCRADDSPWYPTVRLLRRIAPGDWCGAIAALVPLADIPPDARAARLPGIPLDISRRL